MEFIFPTDDSQSSASDGMLELLAHEMKAKGGFFSRPRKAFGAGVISGESGAPIIRKLKNIFDPDRIFTPDNLVFTNGSSS